MNEQLKAEGIELYKAAVACGMDIEDAFDDVAASIDAATKAVPSMSPKGLGDSIQYKGIGQPSLQPIRENARRDGSCNVTNQKTIRLWRNYGSHLLSPCG